MRCIYTLHNTANISRSSQLYAHSFYKHIMLAKKIEIYPDQHNYMRHTFHNHRLLLHLRYYPQFKILSTLPEKFWKISSSNKWNPHSGKREGPEFCTSTMLSIHY